MIDLSDVLAYFQTQYDNAVKEHERAKELAKSMDPKAIALEVALQVAVSQLFALIVWIKAMMTRTV